jgi:hypothetical protein
VQAQVYKRSRAIPQFHVVETPRACQVAIRAADPVRLPLGHREGRTPRDASLACNRGSINRARLTPFLRPERPTHLSLNLHLAKISPPRIDRACQSVAPARLSAPRTLPMGSSEAARQPIPLVDLVSRENTPRRCPICPTRECHRPFPTRDDGACN